jgi:glycosyltransferase involved in cell wall biosynthesis
MVDVDLDDGRGDLSFASRPRVLVVARRDGVPVGSGLFERPPPSHRDTLVAGLRMRPDDPPPSSGTRVRVTVAVCTRDRPRLLQRCLASIAAADAVAGEEVELDLLVVDNASADDETRRTAFASGARCVREPIPGLDFARNRAVQESRGEVVAFVDDDAVVDPTWLRTLIRSFAAEPDARAVSGQVLALRVDTPARFEFERTTGFSLGWDPTMFTLALGPEMPFRPGMGVGCNMAFRRDALDAVGPFDEALDTGRPLPGGGDLDIMIRMVLAGGVFFEPSATVFHEHRADWAGLRYQFYTWGKGWAAVLDKWYRSEPTYRRRIRGVSKAMIRSLVSGTVRGPRRTGSYRRWHCVVFGVGFVVGWMGTYGRSVKRVDARRRSTPAVSAERTAGSPSLDG